MSSEILQKQIQNAGYKAKESITYSRVATLPEPNFLEQQLMLYETITDRVKITKESIGLRLDNLVQKYSSAIGALETTIFTPITDYFRSAKDYIIYRAGKQDQKKKNQGGKVKGKGNRQQKLAKVNSQKKAKKEERMKPKGESRYAKKQRKQDRPESPLKPVEEVPYEPSIPWWRRSDW